MRRILLFNKDSSYVFRGDKLKNCKKHNLKNIRQWNKITKENWRMFHVKQFNYLKAYAKENSIELTEDQISKFDLYTNLLLEKNKVMNLTAITEPKEVEIKHMVDSIVTVPLIIEKSLKIKENCPCGRAPGENTRYRIIDIGTGAGFPGIPLKIILPDANFLLADSLNKRVNFLEEAIEKLDLKEISAIAGRAEDLAKNGEPLREDFDFCVSRAVADMAVLAEYAIPFVKVGGYGIFYKAADCKDEVLAAQKAISEMGAELEEIKEFELPENAGKRAIVIVHKIKATPDKYPRRAGKPSKSPIK